jgi:hypothetical protein
MRKIAHSVNVALLRPDYDYYRSKLKQDAAVRKDQKRARNIAYFTIQVLYALHAARLGYLFDAPPDEVLKILHEGLPDLIEAVGLGGALSPIDMRKYLGAGLLVGEKPMIKWLTRLPEEDFKLPDLQVSAAAYLLVQALQAGGRGDAKEFPAAVAKFCGSLAAKRLVVSPRSEKEIYEPLAGLLTAIADADQPGFDKAWNDQATAWKKRFGRPAEAANMEGILDLETLGIGRIARKFSLQVPPGNPYAPLELLDKGKEL